MLYRPAPLRCLRHRPRLYLSESGDDLRGEDVLEPEREVQVPGFTVRFHLHPLVKVSRLSDGRGAMLMLPSREVWTFNAHEDQVELEESVFLAGPDGPRRTTQIVIYGQARQASHVHWTFAYVDPAESNPRRTARREPELPL